MGWDKGFWGILRFMMILMVLLVLGGCVYEPQEREYEPLSKLSVSGQAVARIYAVPATPLGRHIVHTYLIVKSANTNYFDRWEVWTWSAEPYGYLRKNLYGPEDDFGLGRVEVLAERMGAEAQIVVEFITEHHQDYPYKDDYDLVTGPNCNTFTSWIIQSTHWSMELPDSAWGKDYPMPSATEKSQERAIERNKKGQDCSCP